MSPRSLIVLAAVLTAGCGGSAVVAGDSGASKVATTPTSPGRVDPKAVPLGDGYVATKPRVGYVDSCMSSFGGMGGAQSEGPWIDSSGKTWDYTKKVAVSGQVQWPSASYSVKRAGGKRVINFNDLPIDHTTGRFPIASDDPAYQYDRNPNHIAAQSFAWKLSLHPSAAKKPRCTSGGPIGVLKDGVLLYNALDGEGRDAAAHEVLDACGGHPDMSSSYHHHAVPPCILEKAPKGKTTLVGYALDGYGIYVAKDGKGRLPANPALDSCHGSTRKVRWNGRRSRIFHYVATLEYPYTVGCLHGRPVDSGRPSAP